MGCGIRSILCKTHIRKLVVVVVVYNPSRWHASQVALSRALQCTRRIAILTEPTSSDYSEYISMPVMVLPWVGSGWTGPLGDYWVELWFSIIYRPIYLYLNRFICIYIYIYIYEYKHTYIYIGVGCRLWSARYTMLIDSICRECYKYVHTYQRVAVVTYTFIYIYNYILRGRYLPSSAAADVRRWI